MRSLDHLRLGAALCMAMALTTSPAYSSTTENPAASPKKPNVLLITIDTLRADHLGAYGYKLQTSPEFDRLAEEGVLFTDAITPVPTTAPALASLLTSRHADEHGVRENLGELPESLETLAEAFRSAGYKTAGFFGNGAIQHGFGQGFDVFEPFADHWFFRDRAGTRKAMAWLAQAPQPWFLWIHFMDPHGPYSSSRPATSAKFVYEKSPQLERVLPQSEHNAGFGMIPKYQQLEGHERVVDYVRRYDGEIVSTDREIGRLRAFLERAGVLDDTIVVVTADHGESLGENEYFFQHGTLLNEPSVRVPLILRHPSLPRGLRTNVPASLVDLFPTLAGLTGVPVPEGVAGRDLTRDLKESGTTPETTRVSYTVTPSQKTAVRQGHWELRGTPSRERPAHEFVVVELFDHRTTPPTLVPPGEERRVRATLRPKLRAAAKQVRKAQHVPRKPTKEEETRLRALGYID